MANQEKNQTIENLKEISTLWNNKELLKMSGKLRDIKSKLDGVFRDVNARNNEDDQKQVVQPTPVEKKVVKEEKEFTRPKFVKENKSNNKPFRADRPDFKNNKTQRQNRNNNFERNYEQRQDNTSRPNKNNYSNNKQNHPNNANNSFNKPKTFERPKFDTFIPEIKQQTRTHKKEKKTYNDNQVKKQIRIKSFDDVSGDRASNRKLKTKKEKKVVQTTLITKAIMTSEMISVKDLSEKIGRPAVDIIKQLFILGNMANINSTIDYDSASLVASELGVELELKLEKSYEQQLDDLVHVDAGENTESRPPIVTVMGHVDHGKTSLLDYIRNTRVVAGEAGGITQHIGAYTIEKDGRKITFIDTPGHSAFTAMRARGAQVTDIAVLVVAADDGVMPQTVEAINHIKQANVPMIVAINKMDKPTANVDRIKQQLSEYDVIPEEWGGDTILVPVSAKTGDGIDKLLEMMLLLADMAELKANPNRPAIGTIIEARLDKGRGPVATILVQNGTLKIGNTIICGTTLGRVRAMIDDAGKNVVSAGPSTAVAVLGLEAVPNAGDSIQVVEEKFSKQIIQERKAKLQLEKMKNSGGTSLEEFMQLTGEKKNLNIIIKADVQGSVEALKGVLLQAGNDEVKINCIHSGVGAVNENDVLLAQASNANIIAFNVKTEGKLEKMAEKSGISIKTYKIIYEVLDDVALQVKGLRTPKYERNSLGFAEVRMVYKITGAGLVAGCYVKNGVMRRNAIAQILRNGELIAETTIESLKIFKDDAKEVREGFECGIKLKDASYKEGDIIQAFEEKEIMD